MVADLREMQENQGFSEIWIDKLRFTRISIAVSLLTPRFTWSISQSTIPQYF